MHRKLIEIQIVLWKGNESLQITWEAMGFRSQLEFKWKIGQADNVAGWNGGVIFDENSQFFSSCT